MSFVLEVAGNTRKMFSTFSAATSLASLLFFGFGSQPCSMGQTARGNEARTK